MDADRQTTAGTLADLRAVSGSYDPLARSLHWLVAGLVAGQYVLAWILPEGPRGAPAGTLANLHLSIGVVIALVMSVRLAWRLVRPPPLFGSALPVLFQRLALAGHVALYIGLFALPLTGWVWASGRGWPVTLFGIVRLPDLIETGSSFRRVAGNLHEVIGNLMMFLIAVHVVAALVHHFVLKDDVLRRMWPMRAR